MPNSQQANNSGGVAGVNGVGGVPPTVGFPPNAMQKQESYDNNAGQVSHNLQILADNSPGGVGGVNMGLGVKVPGKKNVVPTGDLQLQDLGQPCNPNGSKSQRRTKRFRFESQEKLSYHHAKMRDDIMIAGGDITGKSIASQKELLDISCNKP